LRAARKTADFARWADERSLLAGDLMLCRAVQ